MFTLYYAEDNFQNYVILEEWETDRAVVFDWDLSDEELLKLYKYFEEHEQLPASYDVDRWENDEEHEVHWEENSENQVRDRFNMYTPLENHVSNFDFD